MFRKVIAYLYLFVDLHETEENKLDDVVESPGCLYLPWPVEIIPQTGSVIRSIKLPGFYSDLEVVRIDYFLDFAEEIIIEICVKPQGENDYRQCNIETLRYFAEEGFLFGESKIPLKEIIGEMERKASKT